MSHYKEKVTKDQWALTGNAFVFALNSDGMNRFWFDVCAGFAGKGERASEDEMQANAVLCIEASNVLHETGMTPRELAEQRAELLAAMKGIEDLGSDGEHSGDRHAKCREMARAAIAKCEGTKP